MAGRFGLVKLGPPIEVFALNKAFLEDENPNKVNLGVGAYRTNEGKPWVLPVVKKVEKDLAADETQNHEYLPVLGLEAFTQAATTMLLGANNSAVTEGRAFGVQTLSGTGALRVGAEFLSRILKLNTFYYSKPTWENHHLVFVNAGFTDPRTYRYWDPETKSIDFKGMCEDIKNAPENSVIILHACAHNPTGCDPTREQWMELAEIMKLSYVSSVLKMSDSSGSVSHCLAFPQPETRPETNIFVVHVDETSREETEGHGESKNLEVVQVHNAGPLKKRLGSLKIPRKHQNTWIEKKLFTFFDSAYQGFASGDLDEDAWAVRYFAEKGFEMLASQSFAKNFGLYNERVGNLTFVVSDKSAVAPTKSQVTLIVRGMYSNPPNHGCRIVATVLKNPILYNEWKECIRIMSGRIKEMRKGLKERLQTLKTPNANKWNHITDQIGMFSYSGLTTQQVEYIVQRHHIYMLKSGRMNMCGLTTNNLDYVAAAIHDAVTTTSIQQS
ncbi:hypothetical protein RUM43_005852 [Polyplax serrata]|uniref:aspartate transaminase n=1 Tax=Polyplax serrata TaxID=468196 RepID=A0AAN8S1R7_POLSC